MEYACFGEGKTPLVVLPGLTIKSIIKSAPSLEGPYKIFRDRFTLYFFDRKKEAAPGYSLPEMADDQAAAIKALGLSDVHVYGMSQGGMIAQYMAIRHPDVIKKMVLGSSTSRAEPLQIKTIGNWARLAEAHDASALVDCFIQDCFTESFVARYRRALLTLYKEISTEELDRFAVFAHACDFVNTFDDLGKINCPVLVLGADKDRVTTLEAAVKMADKLKSEGVPCEFYMYKDCGHAVFDEQREYRERVYNFLNG